MVTGGTTTTTSNSVQLKKRSSSSSSSAAAVASPMPLKSYGVPTDRMVMRIHGKWYDVSKFDHPGGPIALGLGQGRDATALFEAHHPFVPRDRLASMLDKYAVTDEAAAADGLRCMDAREELMVVDGTYHEPFAWDADFANVGSPFWKELRAEVGTYFEGEARRRGVPLRDAYKATPRRWFEMLGLIGLLFALLPFYFAGYWFTLPVVPVVWWLVAVNTMHDGAHFSISSRWWINALLTHSTPSISPLMWYHQHVIGHHSYPNVGFRDPDLAHAPSIMRPHESVRWNRLHRFQLVTLFMIWTLGSSLYMTVVPLKMVLLGSLNRVVRVSPLSRVRIARHVLGRLLAVLCFFVWPWIVFPWWQAIVWATLPLFMHSFQFMLNTQVNHFTPQTAIASDRDFWRHQAATAHSFATNSYLAYIFSGGLNMQIEHHLFPMVNHVHLHAIHPMVKAACLRHGVPYVESSGYFSAMEKYVAHMMLMSSKPAVGGHERVKR